MSEKKKRDYDEQVDWLRHIDDPPDPDVPPGYVAPTVRVETDYSKPVPENQKPQPPFEKKP